MVVKNIYKYKKLIMTHKFAHTVGSSNKTVLDTTQKLYKFEEKFLSV